MRLRTPVLALLVGGVVLALVASGCAARGAYFLVDARPPDADVFVNDVFVGAPKTLEKKRVRLTPGTHRIEVRREGYYQHYADLVVPPDAKHVRLRVKLRPRVLEPGGELE